jgi:hypothetical protein
MSVLPFVLREEFGLQQTAVREIWCMEFYRTKENVMHFTRTGQYITIFLLISHGKIKLSDKSWRKERKEAFRTKYVFFLSKIVPLQDNEANYGTARETTD